MRRRTSSLDVNKRLAMGDQNGTAFSVALLELIQGMWSMEIENQEG